MNRILILLPIVLLITSASTVNGQENLFKHVQDPILDEDQQRIFNHLATHPRHQSAQVVLVDKKVISKVGFNVNLSRDGKTRVRFERKSIKTQKGYVTIIGKTSENVRNITFVQHKEKVVGRFDVKQGFYSLKPIGGKLHALLKVDVDWSPGPKKEKDHGEPAERNRKPVQMPKEPIFKKQERGDLGSCRLHRFGRKRQHWYCSRHYIGDLSDSAILTTKVESKSS